MIRSQKRLTGEPLINMFPLGAISTTTTINGAKTLVLVSTTSPTRILGLHMQQENVASLTQIKCGDYVVGKNYAKDYTLDLLNFHCNSDISVVKTGNDEAFVSVTYIREPDYHQVNTSNGFTYGDMVIGFFLFILVVSHFFGGILNRLFGVKIRE